MSGNIGTWEEAISKQTKGDLLWMSDKGYLRYGENPLDFHTVDRSIILLTGLVQKKGQDLIIVYPLITCKIQAPIAYTMLYQFLEKGDHESCVLLLSDRAELREDFLSLNTNKLQLIKIFPLATSYRGTKYRYLEMVKGKGGKPKPVRLLMTGSPFYLEAEPELPFKLIIVDLTTPRFEGYIKDIHKWANKYDIRSIIYLFNNPFHPLVMRLKQSGALLWGWDQEGLQRDFGDCPIVKEAIGKLPVNPFAASRNQLITAVKGMKHEIWICRYEKFEKPAQEAYELLKRLNEIRREIQNIRGP